MKILIYIIALMGLGVGYSNELNSTVILSSNYIYRGLIYYSTDGTSTAIIMGILFLKKMKNWMYLAITLNHCIIWILQ